MWHYDEKILEVLPIQNVLETEPAYLMVIWWHQGLNCGTLNFKCNIPSTGWILHISSDVLHRHQWLHSCLFSHVNKKVIKSVCVLIFKYFLGLAPASAVFYASLFQLISLSLRYVIEVNINVFSQMPPQTQMSQTLCRLMCKVPCKKWDDVKLHCFEV